MSYRRAAFAAALTCGLAVTAVPVATAKTGGRSDSGVAFVSVVHQSGGKQYAAGYAQDKLFGPSSITYVLKVRPNPSQPGTVTVTAKKVTLYTRNGSLSGTGSAKQTTTSTSTTVTDGKLTLRQGAGGQSGHSLVGKFSGTFDANAGVYTFHYHATYK
jgi:hypothetical protein